MEWIRLDQAYVSSYPKFAASTLNLLHSDLIDEVIIDLENATFFQKNFFKKWKIIDSQTPTTHSLFYTALLSCEEDRNNLSIRSKTENYLTYTWENCCSSLDYKPRKLL